MDLRGVKVRDVSTRIVGRQAFDSEGAAEERLEDLQEGLRAAGRVLKRERER